MELRDTAVLWSEKYRPTSIEDICINETKLNIINKWFAEFESHTADKRALLFNGPPGLGKTSLAHVILKNHGYQVKEFNASDVRYGHH